MWQISFRFFVAMLEACIFINAVVVYVLHDVDSDQIENLNSAYLSLMLEMLTFAIVVAAIFLFAIWLGSLTLKVQVTKFNKKLPLFLGIGVIVIQYFLDLIVRALNHHQPSDFVLGAYIFVAPLCCAAILISQDRRQQRPA